MKFIFVDTETGGLNENENDVLQLAWELTDEDYNVIRSNSFFLKRRHPATQRAIELNGLTDAFLNENATDEYEVYRLFGLELKEADCLVAHYAPFDKAFIKADVKRRISGLEPEIAEGIIKRIDLIRTIDTKRDYMYINREWSLRNHPGPYLDEMCHYLGVESKHLRFHRADADVEAMRLCLKQIAEINKTLPA